MESFDVAIIGGGIIGTSAAAYLAEAGRSVILVERGDLAAGASGRNSGVVQHPFDAHFADLHQRSIALYRQLSSAEDGFELPERPSGLMLISFDEAAVVTAASGLAGDWPELAPAVLSAGAATAVEPSLAERLAACRIETGYPVTPSAATLAFAKRAGRSGARFMTGTAGTPFIESGRVSGVLLETGSRVTSDQVLIAAGPWTPTLIPGWSQDPFITSLWGVVVSTRLATPPTHVLEELGIDSRDFRDGRMFSLVSVGPSSSVGSTFLAAEPDPAALAPEILDRARAFVPQLSSASIESFRACARPVTQDGPPLIGAVPEIDGLFVCAGHGPWGISTGPASSRLVADQMLGLAAESAEYTPVRVLNGTTRGSRFA